MAKGINIAEIRNEYLKKVAQEVDALGKSKKDNYIDDLELSLFIQKAQEQKGQFTQESFAEVMGLYKNVNTTETDRVELSWSEIGKQGLKSAGNFFKGMFCDEEGFSMKRTAATLGTIGGFVAVSAIPVVGPYIALTAGAGLSGYMGYNGAKNLIEGTKAYYNAKTHEEAQAAEEARFRSIGEELSLLDVALHVFLVFFAQVAHGVDRSCGEEHGGEQKKDHAERIGLKQSVQGDGMTAGKHGPQGEGGEGKMREGRGDEQTATRPRAGNEHEKSGQQRDEEKQRERHVSPSGCGSAPRRWSRRRC